MNDGVSDPSATAIHTFLRSPFLDGGPPETCYNICSNWARTGAQVSIYTSVSLHGDPAGILKPVIPKWVPRKIAGKLANYRQSLRWLMRMAERKGLDRIKPGDICYFWPGTSNDAIEEAKMRGGIIVVEFINTHVAYAKQILEVEYDRLGLPLAGHLGEADIAAENRRIELCDFAFSPGPFTSPSIISCSPTVPPLLETSYGTKPATAPSPHTEPHPIRFLFVGMAGIRKGVPTLLEAWRHAALPAELWFAGVKEPNLKTFDTTGPGIRWLGYNKNISSVYNSVDVFVFPSLEEGGPQVTYEAAAHGLPSIATPMGGGRIANDRRNALIVPPSDVSALAAAMTELFHDSDLRKRLGENARADAAQFMWDRVADERLKMLRNAIASRRKATVSQIA